VVFHDFRLKSGLCRHSDGRWLRGRRLPLVRDLTLGELQSFDVGRPKPGSLYARTHSRVTPRDGETMPTLAQAIEAVRAVKADFRLFIEIKTSIEDEALSARAEEVAEAVIAELRRLDFRNCAILVGFDWAGLIHAKRLDPDVPCWFSTACNSPLGADAIRAAGGDGWFRCYDGDHAQALKDARASRLAFGVWTVNATSVMRSLIAAGADAICTDRPDLLKSLVACR
jgi:glycerophosphoryl diester phosphodiesterase